jgi:hypothetical protein
VQQEYSPLELHQKLAAPGQHLLLMQSAARRLGSMHPLRALSRNGLILNVLKRQKVSVSKADSLRFS